MDEPGRFAAVDIVTANILTASENVNNVNRENELRQAAETHVEATPTETRVENEQLEVRTGIAGSEAVVSPATADVIDNAEKIEILPDSATASTTDITDASDDAGADQEYEKHLEYTAEGVAIYTNPQTGEKMQFDAAQQQWIAYSESDNPYETDYYRWCHETGKWVPKECPDLYTFDSATRSWIPKATGHQVTSTPKEDGEVVHTYTDSDGVVFFWDAEKSAWFPQIDDDFMAKYQMGYGDYQAEEDDDEIENEVKLLEKLLAAKKAEREGGDATANEETSEKLGENSTAKRKAAEPKWFELEEAENTKVYVSNLPLDITRMEFIALMSKYGMIFHDPGSTQIKVKLYADSNGQLKGDGLCDYIRMESVEMALELLNGFVLRGNKIRVERAKFEMRGAYNPALKPKKKKKDKEKLKKMQDKLLDWRPEKMRGERSKHERTVIIKNLFEPKLFEKEVHLIIDYQSDLREECSKCGTVRKIVIYDQHAEGIAQVSMSDPEEADLVVQMMNKRYFGQRQLDAELWDGKTKYKVEESAGDENKRRANWDQFLVEDEAKAEEVDVKTDDEIVAS